MEGQQNQQELDRRIKSRVKELWPQIADEDLESVAAKQEELCRLLQDKLGYTKSEADQRINQILLEIAGRPYL